MAHNAGQVAVQRRARAFVLANQEPRNLIRLVQKPLRDADIDHQHVGHEPRLCLQRRQDRAATCRWRGALRKPKIRERFGRDQRLSGRRDEGLQARSPDRRRVADLRRQRHRFDAEQAVGSPADLHAAFQNRRHRPAGPAQFDKQGLWERCAALLDQHGGPCAAEHGGCAVVRIAGLKVQRLHAAPERGRGNQPDQQCRKLHRMPPPMACENR